MTISLLVNPLLPRHPSLQPLNEADSTAPRVNHTFLSTPLAQRGVPETPNPTTDPSYNPADAPSVISIAPPSEAGVEIGDGLDSESNYAGSDTGTEVGGRGALAFPMMANPAPPPSALFAPRAYLEGRRGSGFESAVVPVRPTTPIPQEAERRERARSTVGDWVESASAYR